MSLRQEIEKLVFHCEGKIRRSTITVYEKAYEEIREKLLHILRANPVDDTDAKDSSREILKQYRERNYMDTDLMAQRLAIALEQEIGNRQQQIIVHVQGICINEEDLARSIAEVLKSRLSQPKPYVDFKQHG